MYFSLNICNGEEKENGWVVGSMRNIAREGGRAKLQIFLDVLMP